MKLYKYVEARSLEEAKGHAEVGNFIDNPLKATRGVYAVEVEITCLSVKSVATS